MKEEKQPQNQELLSEKHQNLNIASQIEGKPVIGNTEITVLIKKPSRCL